MVVIIIGILFIVGLGIMAYGLYSAEDIPQDKDIYGL